MCEDCGVNLHIEMPGSNCYKDWHNPLRARDIATLKPTRRRPDRVQNGDDGLDESETEL